MEDKMKPTLLIISGLTAISLSACGATTGGLAQSMAKQAAIGAVTSNTPTTAAPVAMQSVSVDNSMDCFALTKEISDVDAIILASNETISGSGSSNLAGGLAAAGASQAAASSGAAQALAKVPFGGLFAKKAMDSVANAGRKKVEAAQADLQNATMRKASLSGLYAGKNCGS